MKIHSVFLLKSPIAPPALDLTKSADLMSSIHKITHKKEKCPPMGFIWALSQQETS